MEDAQGKKLFDAEDGRNAASGDCDGIKMNSKVNLKQILGILLSLAHYSCGGLASGIGSIILAQLKETATFEVSKSDASWMTSIVAMPTPFASLLTGFLLHHMPRRTLQIIVTFGEISGWFIIYYSTSARMILLGEGLLGMANAMASPIIVSFLGEISHPHHRGVYLSTVLVGLSLGMLIIHTLGALFQWQTCALLAAAILLCYLCLSVYLKETYAWYVRINNREKARIAFYWYRGADVESACEFEKIIARQQDNTCRDYSAKQMCELCCSKLLLMPLCIAIIGLATTHLSGTKTIMFHSISIVSTVIPTFNQYASTILVDAVRVVVTLLGCLIIKRFPVRKLFIFSGVATALSHFCFAALKYYTTQENSGMFYALALLAFLGNIIFSSIGIVPLAWVIAGEIFPLIVKNIGTGICCFFYFLTLFILVKVAPDFFHAFGLPGGFMIFGFGTLLGTVLMYFLLPETKNKTLKEIENLFR